MLQPELFWRDLIMFFKGADQMTAVSKPGLIGNVIQIIVCKEQQIFYFAEPYKLDVLLTTLTIMLAKQLGKVGIAHMIMVGKILHIDILLGVFVNINQHIMDIQFFIF